jgi:hypothetical protein
MLQVTELLQRDKSVISRHINNIFKENELELKATEELRSVFGKAGENIILPTSSTPSLRHLSRL